VTRWPTGLVWEMICQVVAQRAGKSVIFAHGLSRRRLRRSDGTMMIKATADAKEEIIHSEVRDEAVDASAWIDAVR
jgi:hypothetical protein